MPFAPPWSKKAAELGLRIQLAAFEIQLLEAKTLSNLSKTYYEGEMAIMRSKLVEIEKMKL